MSAPEGEPRCSWLKGALTYALLCLGGVGLVVLLTCGFASLVFHSRGGPPPEPPEVGKANLWTIEGLPAATYRVGFAPRRPFLAARSAGRLMVWDVEAQPPKLALDYAEAKWVEYFTFSPDGSRLLASFHGEMRSWRTDTWRALPDQTPREGVDLIFSPDGRRMGTVLPGKQYAVWEGKEQWRLVRRAALPYQPREIALWDDPGSALLASEKEMEVVDLSSGRVIRRATLSTSGSPLRKLRLVPRRRVVATLIEGKNKVALWRLPDLTPCGGVDRREELEFRDFAFSPDGKMVATIGGRLARELSFLRIWDTDSGRLLGTLRARGRSLKSVAWSPDGAVIATGGEREYGIRGWDVQGILGQGQRD
jgi:WD40 repeat protein